MKRFSKVTVLAFGMLFAAVPQHIFAQSSTKVTESEDDSEEYEGEGDFYEEEETRLTQNGAGDQFIQLSAMPIFPFGFGDQLYVGGGLGLGYHRFITEHIAVGIDAMFGYNPTIGSNMFTFIPFSIGITYQPYIGHFEFPITLNVGAAVETYLQYNYFPGLFMKGDIGCFYRINENWSAGLQGSFIWLPQWIAKDPEKSKHYCAATAAVCARYHF